MDIENDGHNWAFDWDRYESEAGGFERDVYMLILTGLDAGMKLLTAETQSEDDKLMVHLTKANGGAAEHLAQEQADMWIQLSQTGSLPAKHGVGRPVIPADACVTKHAPIR